MPSGKVKFFDVAKGYGFLVPDEGGRDVFVHMRQVRRAKLKELVPGETLLFEVTEERGRPEAAQLQRPSAEPKRRVITLKSRETPAAEAGPGSSGAAQMGLESRAAKD